VVGVIRFPGILEHKAQFFTLEGGKVARPSKNMQLVLVCPDFVLAADSFSRINVSSKKRVHLMKQTKIYPIHLQEILHSMARRILSRTARKVPRRSFAPISVAEGTEAELLPSPSRISLISFALLVFCGMRITHCVLDIDTLDDED